MALELRLTPLTVLLRSVLDQLQDKDPARIFAQPVSLKEVGVRTALSLLPLVHADQGEPSLTCILSSCCYFTYFLFILLYFFRNFTFRGRGREGEGEEEKH